MGDHCLCCVPLWTAVISNSFKSVELSWTHPMMKRGLVGSSKEWFQISAIVFACYQSIEMNQVPEIIHVLKARKPWQVHVRLMHCPRAHFVALRMVDISSCVCMQVKNE